MSTVREVLASKRSTVLTIRDHATVYEAIQKMVDRNVGSIIVENESEVVGIFTERDYLRRMVLEHRIAEATPVREVMTTRVLYTEPDQSVDACMNMMTEQRIRHIPVLEHGRLIGLVSIGDLVKFTSSERSFEVKFLTDYITGQYPGELDPGLTPHLEFRKRTS